MIWGATKERIRVLDSRLVEMPDDSQKQLDAANCRAGCPPEIIDPLSKEMPMAMDVVVAQIHAEVTNALAVSPPSRWPRSPFAIAPV